MIIIIIVLIFGGTRSGKGKTTRTVHGSSQQTHRQAGPGQHPGGRTLHLETEALLFCPASLMLPCPQFRDLVLSPFCFIFWKKKKKESSFWLSAQRGEKYFRLFWALFLSTYFNLGVPPESAVPVLSPPCPQTACGVRLDTVHYTAPWGCPEWPHGLPVSWIPPQFLTCRAVEGRHPGRPGPETWPAGLEVPQRPLSPPALPLLSRSWVQWLPGCPFWSLALQKC